MIITVSNDEITFEAVRIIKMQNRSNSGYRFEQTLVDNQNNLRLEADGKIPERITFVGHSGWTTYGGKNANKFADDIIAMLKEAAKADPRIKNSLTQIDLVGCHVGYVNEEGKGYMLTVASRLLELKNDGFNEIKVSAFTNLLLAEPYPFYKLLATIYDADDNFSIEGFRTEKSYKAFTFLQEKATKIEEEKIVPLEEELLKIRTAKTKLREQHLQNKSNKTTLELNYNNLLTTVDNDKAKIAKLQENYYSLESTRNSYIQEMENEKKENKLIVQQIQNNSKKLDAVNEKINQNISQFDSEIETIVELVIAIKQDAVKRNSAWVKQIDDCVNEINTVRSNQNLSPAQKVIQIHSAIENTAKTIRNSFFGSPGAFFGKGSTAATELEKINHRQKFEEINNLNQQLNQFKVRQEQLKNYSKTYQHNLEQSNAVIEKHQKEIDHVSHEMLQIKQRGRTLKKEIVTNEAQLEIMKKEAPKLTQLGKQTVSEGNQLLEKEKEIEAKIEELTTQVTAIKEKANAHVTVIVVTDNIRNTLDLPQCNFTHLVKQQLEEEKSTGLRI